jgi:hypothetical protein
VRLLFCAIDYAKFLSTFLSKRLEGTIAPPRLFHRTPYEAMALRLAQPDPEVAQAEAMLEWMTATQLARYWQNINAEGEPTTAGIMKWAKRSADEHPLPPACMGDLLRFKREEVDRWAQEEAARRSWKCVSR